MATAAPDRTPAPQRVIIVIYNVDLLASLRDARAEAQAA